IYWLAFVVRFEGSLPGPVVQLALLTLPFVLLIKFVWLGAFAVRRSPWRFIDLRGTQRIFLALALAFILLVGSRLTFPFLGTLLPPVQYIQIPLGVLVIDLLLGFCGLVAVRVGWRLLAEHLECA